MDERPRFSLRFLFEEVFWIAVVFALLRLLPVVTPFRLITDLSIGPSLAPFVLLVPALLLAATMTAIGAGFGNLLNARKQGAVIGAATGLCLTTIFLLFLLITVRV
jgi:hypothetical protein